jgi:hypothetical protein
MWWHLIALTLLNSAVSVTTVHTSCSAVAGNNSPDGLEAVMCSTKAGGLDKVSPGVMDGFDEFWPIFCQGDCNVTHAWWRQA